MVLPVNQFPANVIMDHYDIWYEIFGLLNFKSKLAMKSASQASQKNLIIKDLYNIPARYLLKLNDDVLVNFPETRCLKLYVNYVSNLSILRNLKTLYIANDPHIHQGQIQHLDLTELNAEDNPQIRDVHFMKNLKILNARGVCCGIDQAGIRGLNLQKLDAGYNKKITNISFMTNLKILNISGSSGIGQTGIPGLDLWELVVADNDKIYDLTFMTGLKKLVVYGGLDSISQTSIRGLNLTELDIAFNPKIQDVTFMTNLKKLNISGKSCGVAQSGIQGLDLVELNANNNNKILDVSFMKNLKILDAGSNCAIDEYAIRGLQLKILKTDSNPNFVKKISKRRCIKSIY